MKRGENSHPQAGSGRPHGCFCPEKQAFQKSKWATTEVAGLRAGKGSQFKMDGVISILRKTRSHQTGLINLRQLNSQASEFTPIMGEDNLPGVVYLACDS